MCGRSACCLKGNIAACQLQMPLTLFVLFDQLPPVHSGITGIVFYCGCSSGHRQKPIENVEIPRIRTGNRGTCQRRSAGGQRHTAIGNRRLNDAIVQIGYVYNTQQPEQQDSKLSSNVIAASSPETTASRISRKEKVRPSASGHWPKPFEDAEVASYMIWQSRNLPAAIGRRPTA